MDVESALKLPRKGEKYLAAKAIKGEPAFIVGPNRNILPSQSLTTSYLSNVCI